MLSRGLMFGPSPTMSVPIHDHRSPPMRRIKSPCDCVLVPRTWLTRIEAVRADKPAQIPIATTPWCILTRRSHVVAAASIPRSVEAPFTLSCLTPRLRAPTAIVLGPDRDYADSGAHSGSEPHACDSFIGEHMKLQQWAHFAAG